MSVVQTVHAQANAALSQGEIEVAVSLMRHALELDPNNREIWDGLLSCVYWMQGYTARQIVADHRQWAEQFAKPLKSKWREHSNSRESERPLRIGYVSPDLRIHPVGRFMLPFFHESRQGRFGIDNHVYSHAEKEDALSERIKPCVAKWQSIRGLDDDAAALQIRADGIDILVDLTMHLVGNRLLIFARKPAPVQVTYLAYAGTTGLDSIDYRITDQFLDPTDDVGYVEKPMRVPHFWCYKASIYEAEPIPPAFHQKSYVTFGCLNNLCKVNHLVRRTWIRVMGRVPNSRLMVHAYEGQHRDKFVAQFKAGGITADRIEFVPLLNLANYTRKYQEIDIALDPFPYTGGTTTCDAIWMGVPVVTLAGDIPSARGGVSILSAIGRSELIATKTTEYEDIAVKLAENQDELTRLHHTLRPALMASGLWDVAAFTRSIVEAFRKMWREHCAAG